MALQSGFGNMFRYYALIAVAALAVAGCATGGGDAMSGSSMIEQKVGTIKEGVTTKGDVQALFGSPMKQGRSIGYDHWSYQFPNENSSSLTLVFEGDTVKEFNYYEKK